MDEYRKHVEKDRALERRFQSIIVGQPSVEETIRILREIKDRYETHHSAIITEEAVSAAVRLSQRYIADRFLPDKAIDVMDEAGSRARLKSLMLPAS
jgi:ATP-dependent Clp protease ATP-binding subunit ClpC